MDREEADARWVYTRDDQVRADVALVAEEVLLEQCHDGNDAGGAARAESVELHVGGCEGGSEFGVGGCASARTPDGGAYVMEFLAVLVCDDGAGGGAGVCCYLWGVSASSSGSPVVRVRSGGRSGSSGLGVVVRGWETYYDAIIEYAAYDRGTCACGFW